MVESERQVKIGKAHGAFSDTEFIRVDLTMDRLCAPTQPGIKSFILWTKENCDDCKPTWDKVVRSSF